MAYYHVSAYLKDGDTKNRHLLGYETISASSSVEARDKARAKFWDEQRVLAGVSLELEVEEAAEVLFEASVYLLGPDGSRTWMGEEAVWSHDEAHASDLIRDKHNDVIRPGAGIDLEIVLHKVVR